MTTTHQPQPHTDGIPDDIMNTARAVAMRIAAVLPVDNSDDVKHIANAILAERERCASVAEAKMYDFGCIAGTDASDFVEICAEIAAGIRSLPKTKYTPSKPNTDGYQDAWEPIDTAPKDGTPVLICEGDYVDAAQNFFDTDHRSEDKWFALESADVVSNNPSFWQPLPKPPSTTQSHDGEIDR